MKRKRKREIFGADAAPVTPPPRDWFHFHAKQAEEIERLEGRVIVLESYLKDTPPAYVPPEERIRDAFGGAYVPPDGVVPPHVRRNLEALAEWVNPNRWVHGSNFPEADQAKVHTIFEHVHGLVLAAMRGEDVPRP